MSDEFYFWRKEQHLKYTLLFISQSRPIQAPEAYWTQSWTAVPDHKKPHRAVRLSPADHASIPRLPPRPLSAHPRPVFQHHLNASQPPQQRSRANIYATVPPRLPSDRPMSYLPLSSPTVTGSSDPDFRLRTRLLRIIILPSCSIHRWRHTCRTVRSVSKIPKSWPAYFVLSINS